MTDCISILALSANWLDTIPENTMPAIALKHLESLIDKLQNAITVLDARLELGT
jgi:hypothetical protein